MIDRSKSPNIKAIKSVDLLKPEVFKLSNGVEVWGINAGSQELVKVDFIFDAGARHQAKRLVAGLTNSFLDKGSDNFSEQEIAEVFDFHGAYLQLAADHDFGNVSLFTLNKFAKPIFETASDFIFKPSFPENAIWPHIKKRQQKFIIDNQKVKTMAHKTFTQKVFGSGHPYANFNVSSDFDSLKAGQFAEHHKMNYLTGFRLMVSGRYNDVILQLIEDNFGKLSLSGTKRNVSTIDASQGEKITFLAKDGAVQNAIRIGRKWVKRTHADYFGLQVLNTILGGYFGSRLMRNIREDKGYTYGIRSSIINMPLDSYFVIGTEVGSDVSSNALNEIYFEIAKLQNERVSIEELSIVKNYLSGEMLRSFDGMFAMSDSLRTLYDFELPLNYYQKFMVAIQSITPEVIQSLANQYLNRDDLFEVVAGK